VWHVSVRAMTDVKAIMTCFAALEGLGDSELGQWEEAPQGFHLRRRLSYKEMVSRGLNVRDLRGTEEGKRRIDNIIRTVPDLRNFALSEWAK
jgi:hypothetical protein